MRPAQASMEVDAKQEEVDNNAAGLPVHHLLLCVHGIGQNLTGANIAGEGFSSEAPKAQF